MSATLRDVPGCIELNAGSSEPDGDGWRVSFSDDEDPLEGPLDEVVVPVVERLGELAASQVSTPHGA